MLKQILISFLLVVTIVPSYAQTPAVTGPWRCQPIRSIEEFNSGAYGGEGEQHPHSMDRCMFHPEYIYLSHDVGGTWHSYDNGETWKKNTDRGLYLQFGQSIAVDPYFHNLLFLIVDPSYNYKQSGDQGIYRSTNGGGDWTHVLTTNTKIERRYRHNIAYAPHSADSIHFAQVWYAALMDNGLYRSDDAGLSWGEGPVSSLEGHSIVYEVRPHPTEENTVYVCSDLGLFKSEQAGAGLARVEALPENISSICINPRHPDSIYATAHGSAVYLSIDGGMNYEKMMDYNVIRLHMNPGFPEQIYMIGNSRNSRMTNDGGETWQDLPQPTTFPGLERETGWRRWIDGNLSAVLPNIYDKNESVAFSRSTLFKTTDAGASFHESATGWTGNAWTWTDNSMAFDPNDSNRYALFCNDVGTRITSSGGDWFHESTNSEAGSWYAEKKIGWYGTYAGDFNPAPGSNVMIAAIGTYFRTQLMRSEDLGQTWELLTEGEDDEEMHLYIAFSSKDTNIVYAGNKKSTDAGRSFKRVEFPDGLDNTYIIGSCKYYPEIVYGMNRAGTVIYRSCDEAESWEEYARPGWKFCPFDPLPTFAACPVNPKIIYTVDASGDLARFDGATWTSLGVLDMVEGGASYNFVRNVAIDPNNPNIIYAGMFASGSSVVFRSTDMGATWKDITSTLSHLGGALKVNPHTGELFHGTMFGTWIHSAPYDEVVPPDNNLLTGLMITFDRDSVAIGGKLQLEVTDLTGCIDMNNISWYSYDEDIATVDPNGLVSGVGQGVARIRVYGQSGQYSDFQDIVVSDKIGVEEDTDNSIKIEINNNSQIVLSGDIFVHKIVISDLPGNIVDAREIGNNINAGYSIDISDMSRGFYYLRIETENRVLFRKILW